MSQDSDLNKSSFFTLKRVLICLGLVGVVVSVVLEVLRSKEHQQWDIGRTTCLEAMGRMHKALTLYRADNDDFSPFIEKAGPELMMARLKRYAGNKVIECEQDQYPVPYRLRVIEKTSNSDIKFPFGVEDNSLELEPCSEHQRYRTIVRLRDIFPDTNLELEKPYGGVLNVLLRSGSARSIPGVTKWKLWVVKSDKFESIEKQNSPANANSVELLPFEPRPPRFEY